MVLNTKLLKNFTKAAAYSTIEVASTFTPHTVDIARSVSTGVNDTRNYIRRNLTRIGTYAGEATDRGTIGSRLRKIRDDAYASLNAGTHSLEDLMDDIGTSLTDFEYDIEESTLNDVGSSNTENANLGAPGGETGDGGAELPFEQAQLRMAATVGKTQIDALRQLNSTIAQSQLATSEFMTTKLGTMIYTSQTMQMQHFKTVEKQLDAINRNLIQIAEFQQESTITAHKAEMSFYDEMTGYMSRQAAQMNGTAGKYNTIRRKPSEGFMSEDNFSMGRYKKIVRDNLRGSEVGMMVNAMTGFDINQAMDDFGSGKVDYRKLATNAILRSLVPKQTRRALKRGDDMMTTLTKIGLSRLGAKRYTMDENPILGILGSIFGIDTKEARKIKLGQYNHGDRNWNGEAQKALVSVIPRHLANIESLLSGRETKYFDQVTGRYMSQKEIKSQAARKFQMAIESPFANIFNEASLDPDAAIDKQMWERFGAETKQTLQKIITSAVNDNKNGGLTQEVIDQLQGTLFEAVRGAGGRDTDARRMFVKLAEGVNKSRDNIRDLFHSIESNDSALNMFLPYLSNEWGNIDYNKFLRFVNSKGIDLVGANAGQYSVGGQRYDFMGSDVKTRTRAASQTTQNIVAFIDQMENSGDPRLAKMGSLINQFRYGSDTARSRLMTGAVDEGFGAVADFLTGRRGIRRRTRGGGGGPTPPTPPTPPSGGGNGGPGGSPPGGNGSGRPGGGSPPGGNGSGGGPQPPSGSDNDLVSRLSRILAGTYDRAEELRDRGTDLANRAREAAESAREKIRTAASSSANPNPTPTDENGQPIVDRLRDAGAQVRERIRAASSSSTEEEGEPERKSITADFIRNTRDKIGDKINEIRTADASEEMRDILDRAFGEDGYMDKLYNNPQLQKALEKAKKSKVGQQVGKGVGAAKSAIKGLATQDYVDPETGEATKSLKTTVTESFSKYKDVIMNQLGIEPSTGEAKPEGEAEGTPVGEAQRMRRKIKATTDAVAGKEEDPSKVKQSIAQRFQNHVKNMGVKGIKGAAIGAGASILTGGHLGLLASMFLPGGPIGAAVLGAGLSMLSRNDTFQNVVFGPQDKNGERDGGIISKKLRDSFKAHVPDFIKGSARGVGLGLVGKILAMTAGGASLGGALGLLPSMLMPGGIIGSALMGIGGTMLSKNEGFMNTMFGKDDGSGTGARQGAFLSKAYNFVTGKISDVSAGGPGQGSRLLKNRKRILQMLKGAAGGAITASLVGQMGILGSALTLGGPIGGAIMGTAIGIASSSDRFNQYIFGTKDPDSEDRKKDGLIGRFQTALELDVLEPMKTWFTDEATQFAMWSREKLEIPARMLVEPIVDSFRAARDGVKDRIGDVFDRVGDRVTGMFQKVIEPLGGVLFNKLLKPIGKFAGSMLKGSLYGVGTAASLPLQMLAHVTSKKRRDSTNNFADFIGQNMDSLLAQQRANETEELKGQTGLNALHTRMKGAKERFVMRQARRGGVWGSLFMKGDTLMGSDPNSAASQYRDEMVRQQEILNGIDPKDPQANTPENQEARAEIRSRLRANDHVIRTLQDRKRYQNERENFVDDRKERRKLDRYRSKLRFKDRHNREAVLDYDDDKYDDITKKLGDKYGVEIRGRQDLQKFLYDYAGWKSDRDAENQSAFPPGGESNAAGNEQQRLEAKSEEYHNNVIDSASRIHEVLLRIEANTGGAADAARASLDLETGPHFDTDTNVQPGKSISEVMDSGKAADIRANLNRESANSQAAATVRAISALTDRQSEEERLAALRGNDSGSATDESLIPVDDKGGPLVVQNGGEEKKSWIEKAGGFLADKAGGFLSSLGSSAIGATIGSAISAALPYIAPVAIGGLVITLLKNDEFRNSLGESIKGLAQKVLEAPKDIAHALGFGGEEGGARVLETDEEGNATKTVKNTRMMKDIGFAALNAPSTVKAAGTLARGAGALAKGANTLLTKTMKPIGWAEKAAGWTAQKAGNLGTKVWEGAKKLAATEKEGNTLLGKAFTLIEDGLKKAAEGKLGKGAVAQLKKITDFFSTLKTKIAQAAFGKWAPRLSAALAGVSTKLASYVTPMALLNVTIAAGAGIAGAWQAERLFKVNKDEVDGKMRLISGVWEAVCSVSGMGALVAVISDIVAEFTGYDFMQSVASILYGIIGGDTEGLNQAIAEMQQEVANYNAANGTNISLSAYNDLKNKSLTSKIGNGIAGLFGKGDQTDYSQYEVGNFNINNYSTASTQAAKVNAAETGTNPPPASDSKSPNTANATGYGGASCMSGKLVGYGTGFQQDDPRWAGMSLGKLPGGADSTMGVGGCGPTALANAAQAAGYQANPKDVASFAAQNGYLSKGGANDGLFDDGASQMGIPTKRIKNPNEIENDLRNGKPVVLAGKDSSGKTPYSGAGHIVTATGLTPEGDVVVEDPQRPGNYAYKMSDLKSKLTSAWTVGDKSTNQKAAGATDPAGYGLFDSLFGDIGSRLTSAFQAMTGIGSVFGKAEDEENPADDGNGSGQNGTGGGSMNGNYTKLSQSESSQRIYDYLRDKGFTPVGASGLMGCWQAESSNRADRVEGDFLKKFPGFDQVLASNDALNDYTTNILFPAYKSVKINKNGYLGADGNYYPGIGLAQWTGPRGYKLFQHAQSTNSDWRDLDTQLSYFTKETANGKLRDKLNAASTPAEAAAIGLDNYEMSPGFAAKNPSWTTKRADFANSIYNLYATKESNRADSSAAGQAKKDARAAASKATGYGLFDGLDFTSGLADAFKSVFLKGYDPSTGTTSPDTGDGSFGGGAGRQGLLVDGDNPYNTSGATSSNPYVYTGPGLQGQKDVVNKMGSIAGTIDYSLSGPQNPDKGSASCASTVAWAYRKALGVNGMSASSTAQSKDPNFTTIWTNDGSGLDPSILQPGDILYQNWRQTRNNGKMQHTEMYAGYNTDLSHGGSPKFGPVSKGLNDYRRQHTMMVRRYTGFMNQPTGSTSSASDDNSAKKAAGYGLFGSKKQADDWNIPEEDDTRKSTSAFNVSAMGQMDPDEARGYGISEPTESPSHGVETRLDRIIQLLGTIASNGSAALKVKPSQTTNINYGPADTSQKPQVQPIIVPAPQKKQPGGDDAKNQQLRAAHRRIASVERFD